MKAWISDAEGVLREDAVAGREPFDSGDGSANVEADRADTSTRVGGLEWKDCGWELGWSAEEARLGCAAPICVLMTVPRELSEEMDEWERIATTLGDELPMATTFGLELPRGTRLGLDDGPIGTTLGLEESASTEGSAGRVWEEEEDSGGTGLMVGVTVGRTSASSSETARDDATRGVSS